MLDNMWSKRHYEGTLSLYLMMSSVELIIEYSLYPGFSMCQINHPLYSLPTLNSALVSRI